MRSYRLVSGNLLDRPQISSAAADEAGRPFLHLDVSHLRDGGLPGPSLPAAEGQVFLGAGSCLYGSHLPDGVRHREPLEAARHVSLGLQPLSSEL